MTQFSLAPEEIDMLREILTDYVSDLRMEVANTDSMDFREELKKKEAFVKDFLERLQTIRIGNE